MTTKLRRDGISQQAVVNKATSRHSPPVKQVSWYGSSNIQSLIVGGYLPDWKHRLRHFQNATTDLDVSGRRCAHEFGRGQVDFVTLWSPSNFSGKAVDFGYHDVYGNAWFWAGEPPWPVFNIVGNTARDIALRKFIRHAKEVKTQFQSGIFTGELKETIGMLTRPGRALRQGLQSYVSLVDKRGVRIKRSRVGSLRERLRDTNRMVADTWLEAQFGLLPFVSDIEAAAAALTSTQWHRPVPVRGRGEDANAVVHPSYSAQWPGCNIFYLVHSVTENRRTVKFYGAVKAGPMGDIAKPPNLTEKWGLGVQDFAPTIWELLPGSFLADYFSNIGDIIEAYSFCQGSMAWMAESRYDTSTRKWSGTNDELRCRQSLTTPHSDPTYRGSSVTLGPAFATTTVIQRRPTLALPMPEFHFEIPGLGSKKWLNIGALLASSRQTSAFLTKPR